MKRFMRDSKSLIYCVCEIIVGVLILIDPIAFTSAIIKLLGVVLAIIGAFDIMAYFKLSPEIGSMSMGFSKGLVFVLCGLFCVLNPNWFSLAFPILAIAYGVGILVIGLIKLQWAVDTVRLHGKYWLISALGGLSSVILGIIIICNPFTTTSVMWTFVGITLIIEAVIDAVSAIAKGKRARAEDKEHSVEITDI